ncbi:50S ribosomal protein L32 [Myxococcota bacterium]|nr:50S ribosomal protein L32 [Myxococcota bacterium]MBU1379957.1 50S ribosomal protein L32 [Myxococcota bacterium]MBU1496487.1 50S ribosomal protein L32 [Myxococcota bacterium]
MAVPKQRQSKMRRDSRRAQHDKVTPPNTSACPNCGEPRIPHRACPSCGQYKEKEYDSLIIGR